MTVITLPPDTAVLHLTYQVRVGQQLAKVDSNATVAALLKGWIGFGPVDWSITRLGTGNFHLNWGRGGYNSAAAAFPARLINSGIDVADIKNLIQLNCFRILAIQPSNISI